MQFTDKQAADFLNISVEYLKKLLDEGTIPYAENNEGIFIKFSDASAYKTQLKIKQKEALRRLTELMEENGIYD